MRDEGATGTPQLSSLQELLGPWKEKYFEMG